MVTVPRQRVSLRAAALGLLLSGVCACSAFDPVEETRFELLHEGDHPQLEIFGAYWHAYDDQHSRTSPCTNGAAGRHAPEHCAHLDKPRFSWQGTKCPPSATQLEAGNPIHPEPNGSICIQGQIEKLLDCENPKEHCYSPNGQDVSNMWGAGVGLEFSNDGKQPWSAVKHGVKGVAFDLNFLPENGDLNLRVEIPTVFLPGQEPVSPNRPLMRDDGSVIGTNDKLYRYDCDAQKLVGPSTINVTGSLADVVATGSSDNITSDQHPYGSAFWQPNPMDWDPSPTRRGHNEFRFDEVALPPATDGDNYPFDKRQIAGIHFHVVQGIDKNETKPFSFCISNLALLYED
jgi:hypothetical protein